MLDILFENILALGLPEWLQIGFIYVIVFTALRMLWFLLKNRTLSKKSIAYSQPFAGGKRILVLGDSTAVGAGAENPNLSIAGRLGNDLPTCEIRNLGTNGARTADVLEQIEQVKNEMFDLIIIGVGGNDVWHFTPLGALRQSIMLIADEANRLSNNQTIFLVYSNIGSAPLFPRPLRYFLKKRAEKIRSLFMQISGERGAFAIDLSTEHTNHNNGNSLQAHFAADRIHPSTLAYEEWYKKIWQYIAKDNLFCRIEDRPMYQDKT